MTENVQPNEVDDFDTMFNTIASGEQLEPPADPPAEPTPDEPPADPVPDETPADPVPIDPPADPVPDEPPEPPAEPKPVESPAEARIRALEEEIARLRTPAPPAPQETPQEAPPVYSQDEEAFITQYREDWSDVAKGEALVRRAEYKELVQYVFDQIHAAYGPVIDYVTKFSGKDQYNTIKSMVDDYDDVRDSAIAWIDTQPAFLQPAYKRVVEEGSPEEVAEFIRLYKEQTGRAHAPEPSVPPETPQNIKKAAQALRVVTSRRSNVGNTPDPDDFEAAFQEFANRK